MSSNSRPAVNPADVRECGRPWPDLAERWHGS